MKVLHFTKKDAMPFMGQRLRNVRKARHLTQKELAKRLNIKQNRISEYENNKAEPVATTLSEIAEELKCSADFLLGLKTHEQVDDLSDFERDHIRRLRLADDPDAVLASSVQSLINNRSSD